MSCCVRFAKPVRSGIRGNISQNKVNHPPLGVHREDTIIMSDLSLPVEMHYELKMHPKMCCPVDHERVFSGDYPNSN